MTMSAIQPGTHVLVTTADRQELTRRAVSEVIQGEDFPVVWITTEEEWESAETQGARAEAWPWPAEDVRLAERQPA